ncbi:MAG: hypothetical protein IJX88_00400 [Clostridia bacterium]|nr:hypothetical protein [Clostridia bacterium]
MKRFNVAKECTYIAVFVALAIAGQLALSVLPNVEVVTVLFVCYAFVFGVRRGMVAATAFSLLRQLVFGFFPTVLALYLIYYNVLALSFGLLGRCKARGWKTLSFAVLLACVCTAGFTLLDNVLTPLWYGYTKRAAQLYFAASLPIMATHLLSVFITVALLFFPLTKAFATVRSGL